MACAWDTVYKGASKHALNLSILLLLLLLQGRYKRPVAADGMCMGQEFVKKPANMGPWIGEMILTAAAKVFSSSTQVRLTLATSVLCTLLP